MTQPFPTIPAALKKQLPAFSKAHYLPARFEDSTHDLWVLDGSNTSTKRMLLKVCRNTDSPFWQIMRDLFGFDLTAEITRVSAVYQQVEQASPLSIPPLISAGSFAETASVTGRDNPSKVAQNAYLLSHFLPGDPVITPDSAMIDQLAMHLAALHRLTSTRWGSFSRPSFDSSQWHDRLAVILTQWSKRHTDIAEKTIAVALEQSRQQSPEPFVALIPDLRWDQFLHQDRQLSALVDLDAFVFAPRELDFVLLEYLLNEAQLHRFATVYQESLPVPDISSVRPAYRLLLFFMQVLGETDYDRWMARKEIL